MTITFTRGRWGEKEVATDSPAKGGHDLDRRVPHAKEPPVVEVGHTIHAAIVDIGHLNA